MVSLNPGLLLTLAIATGFWLYFQPFGSAHVTSCVKLDARNACPPHSCYWRSMPLCFLCLDVSSGRQKKTLCCAGAFVRHSLRFARSSIQSWPFWCQFCFWCSIAHLCSRASQDLNESTCDFDTPSSCPKDLDFVGWHGMCIGGIQSVEIMRQMRILALAASANAFGPGAFNISGYLVSLGWCGANGLRDAVAASWKVVTGGYLTTMNFVL